MVLRRARNMSESKKRGTHSADFNAKIGLGAIRSVTTINEIAQEHNVYHE
jgi:transposase